MRWAGVLLSVLFSTSQTVVVQPRPGHCPWLGLRSCTLGQSHTLHVAPAAVPGEAGPWVYMGTHISSPWPPPASPLPRPQPEGPHRTRQSSLKSSVLRWAGFPRVGVRMPESRTNVSDAGAGHRDVLSRSGVSFWQRRGQTLLCLCWTDMRSAS